MTGKYDVSHGVGAGGKKKRYDGRERVKVEVMGKWRDGGREGKLEGEAETE